MSFNDYIASSNNSINDNKYNAKKARSRVHQIKQLLRPVLALLKKNQHKKATYKKNAQPEYFVDECEAEQNLANELLEQRIFDEIDCCPEFAAVPVYMQGQTQIVPVARGQSYIPVHFARTDVGTFFWTSITSADSDICNHGDKFAFSEYQTPEIQAPCDRWAQA